MSCADRHVSRGWSVPLTLSRAAVCVFGSVAEKRLMFDDKLSPVYEGGPNVGAKLRQYHLISFFGTLEFLILKTNTFDDLHLSFDIAITVNSKCRCC